MILQVHDELVWECPDNELMETGELVQRVMENACSLSVALITDARYGPNWAQMTPLSNSKQRSDRTI